MTTDVWSHPQVSDLLDDYIHTDSDVRIVEARIPGLFGISKKATYLAFRALGLTTPQAAETMGIDEEQVQEWYSIDPKFAEFELKHLPRLQTNLATELIRMGFMRNMALFIAKDANILSRSHNLDSLTRREFDYLKNVRKHYTSSDLLALEKVLNPDAHSEKITIQLTWGDSQQVIEGVSSGYQLLEAGDADSEPVLSQ